LYLGFVYGWPDWTGFNAQIPPENVSEAYEHKKTLWSWLELLIVPLVLGAAAFFLNQTERRNAEKSVEQRSKVDYDISDQRAQNELLDRYIDGMSKLLLTGALLTSKRNDEIRVVAKTQTLTTIRRLDSTRNKVLIQFLRDAGLIGHFTQNGDDVIDFEQADLTSAKLERVNLQGVILRKADLSDADLYLADLQHANLQGAILVRTMLASANLQSVNLADADMNSVQMAMANLTEANLERSSLLHADMQACCLQKANLTSSAMHSADLSGANLEGATLQNAVFGRGSRLIEKKEGNSIYWYAKPTNPTNFTDASLEGANLRGVNLDEAETAGANLTNADLTDAKINNKQLKKVYSRK
jgi:uncharacterized protein YjbI with pentapeptide repeats